METKTHEELAAMAVPSPALPTTSAEKLWRWACLLFAPGAEPVRLMDRLEYLSNGELALYHRAGSALAFAANDPVLRETGLRNDTAGEAMRFFGLTRHELHELACTCHQADSMTAAEFGRRVAILANWKEGLA
jgi:hypothetical protein